MVCNKAINHCYYRLYKPLRELFSAKETFASPADAVATPSEIVALCVVLKSW